MGAIFIFLSLLLIYNYFYFDKINNGSGPISSSRIAFIKTLITFSSIAYFFAEFLSIFNQLTKQNITVGWIVILFISIAITIKNKDKIHSRSSNSFKLDYFAKKYIYILFFLIVLPLLLLAIFIPPNNWDSLAYHLPRIEHWIQNRNVYPYPTEIYRQILSSPLSEYLILNLNIISDTDAFSNLIQFLSFIGILSIATLIFKQIGVDYKGQLFLVFSLISMPLMIFQSTTTQTDLLASFFYLSFIYFLLLIYQKEVSYKENLILLATCFCLGVLTKFHLALYFIPLVLFFVYLLFSQNKRYISFTISTSILIAVFLLAPLFIKNYYFLGSFTGKDIFDADQTIVNKDLRVLNMFSNNLKHFFDFISLPINSYNNILYSINYYLHQLMGVSEDLPSNNWSGSPFIILNHLDEDTAGSLLHMVLILSVFIFAWFNKYRKNIFYLFGYTVLAISTYGLFFKYSSFDIRLLLPVILLQIMLAVYLIQNIITSSYLYNFLMISFCVIAIMPVYFNKAKPIIANPLQLRRVMLNIPKGEIDSNYYRLIPAEKRNEVLANYSFMKGKYILNEKIDKKTKFKLYQLQDSLGFFEFDKKTVFQKSKLENYFGQQPFLKANIDQLFQDIPTNKNKMNIHTEFDSFEYLIWVYAKNKYDSFYIGSQNNTRYKSYPMNVKTDSFYDIQIVDKDKKWTYKILK